MTNTVKSTIRTALAVAILLSASAAAKCPDLVSISVTRWVERTESCVPGRCEIELDDSTRAYTDKHLANYTEVLCHVHVGEGIHCWQKGTQP